MVATSGEQYSGQRAPLGEHELLLRLVEGGGGAEAGAGRSLDHRVGTEGDVGAFLELEDALLRERRRAMALSRELLRHGAAHRRLLVVNNPRYHSWSLAALLVEESRRWLLEDPQASREFAHLAVEAAQRVSLERCGAALAEDLRARSWLAVGRAETCCGGLAVAEEALEKARQHLLAGTGDPLEEACLEESLASLRGAQGRFAEAESLLTEARLSFWALEDLAGVARTLVRAGVARACRGGWARALGYLEEGLSLMAPGDEPALMLQGRLVRAFALRRLGYRLEARLAVVEVRRLYRCLCLGSHLPPVAELEPAPLGLTSEPLAEGVAETVEVRWPSWL